MLAFCSFLLLFSAPGVHDFHVSKAHVDIEPENREIQITLHLFLDDLEEALARNGHEGLHLGTEREPDSAGAYLLEYFRDHFFLHNGDRRLPYTLVAKELSDDGTALWCYLLVEGITGVRQLTIRNDILMELFDDQKNLLSIRESGKSRDYYMLEKGKAERTTRW